MAWDDAVMMLGGGRLFICGCRSRLDHCWFISALMPRPPTRWLEHSHWWMHSWGSTDPEFIISPCRILLHPFSEACGRVFPIRPIQLLRSMLNYRSSRVFSFSLLPWRWLSLCKWDLNPLSLLLLLLINALQFLVIYFVRFLVDRSSQTINLIDVPHVHSSSFSLFSLVNDGHLRERTSSRAASLNDLGSPVFAPVLFTRMVECCLVAKLPNRQKPSRRHHHFAPLGYWNPFKRIVFPPNYQRLLEYPQSYFTTDDKDLIFLYAAHLFRPFFSL